MRFELIRFSLPQEGPHHPIGSAPASSLATGHAPQISLWRVVFGMLGIPRFPAVPAPPGIFAFAFKPIRPPLPAVGVMDREVTGNHMVDRAVNVQQLSRFQRRPTLSSKLTINDWRHGAPHPRHERFKARVRNRLWCWFRLLLAVDVQPCEGRHAIGQCRQIGRGQLQEALTGCCEAQVTLEGAVLDQSVQLRPAVTGA